MEAHTLSMRRTALSTFLFVAILGLDCRRDFDGHLWRLGSVGPARRAMVSQAERVGKSVMARMAAKVVFITGGGIGRVRTAERTQPSDTISSNNFHRVVQNE